MFLAATAALSTGVLVGMMLTLRRIAIEDGVKAKKSRHQRDPRGRGPASLNWIPDVPCRARVPRGETVMWNPTTDVMIPTSVVELPMTEVVPQVDYPGRGRGIR
jgi:hypothetical protein